MVLAGAAAPLQYWWRVPSNAAPLMVTVPPGAVAAMLPMLVTLICTSIELASRLIERITPSGFRSDTNITAMMGGLLMGGRVVVAVSSVPARDRAPEVAVTSASAA